MRPDQQAYALSTHGDSADSIADRARFLQEARDATAPRRLSRLSVRIGMYGAADTGAQWASVCGHMTRQLARHFCADPWDVTRIAFPVDRFTLIDLRRWPRNDFGHTANCLGSSTLNPLSDVAGTVVIPCPARVYGAVEGRYHTAVVRVDGDLGAIWTVFGDVDTGEPLEASADRQGRAIALFVTAALGRCEDYAALRSGMPGLRHPGSGQDAFFAGAAVRAPDMGNAARACIADATSINAIVP